MFGLDIIPSWNIARALREAPIRSLAEEVDEYERSDPTRTRLLAWTVAAWCAGISLFRPLEAIAFGIALFIVIYRLPASLRFVLAIVRTPVALALIASLVVTAIATAMWPVPYAPLDLLPKRLFLVPLIVIPVLPRWRLLLAGLVVGGVAQMAYGAIAWILDRAGVAPLPFETADGAPATLVVCVVMGLVYAFSAGGWLRIGGCALAAVALWFQTLTSMRAAVAASGAALVAYLAIRPGRTRIALGVMLVAVALLASAILGGERDGDAASSGVHLDYASLNDFSSNRLELWRLTLESCGDRIWLGHGRKAWRAEIDAARPADEATLPEGAELIWSDRRVGYAHNTPIDLLYESGLVGIACIAVALAIVLRAAWDCRRIGPLGFALAAILVGMLAVSQFDFVVRRSILGMLVLLSGCLVFAPRLAERTPGTRSAEERDARLFRTLG
jgi:hypothetical protein